MSNTEPPFTDDELDWYRKYCGFHEVEFATEIVPDATDPTKPTTRLKPEAVRLLHAENLRRWIATVDALHAERDELRTQVLKAEEECTLAVVDRDKARAERDSLQARLDDIPRPVPDNPNGTFIVTAELGTAIRERDEALARVAELEKGFLEIREQYGNVCQDYDTCTHEPCRSSYSAWAIADQLLKFALAGATATKLVQ